VSRYILIAKLEIKDLTKFCWSHCYW